MTSTYGRVDPSALAGRERDPVTGRRGPGRDQQKDRSSPKARAPRRALVVAAIVAAVLLVGGGVFALTRGSGDDETTVEAGAGASSTPSPSANGSSTPTDSTPGTMMTMPPDLTTMGKTGNPAKNTLLWGGTRPDEADPSPLSITLYVDCAKSPCELGAYGKRVPLKGGKFSGTLDLGAGCVGYVGGGSKVTIALTAKKPEDTVTHLTGTVAYHDNFSRSPDGSGTCAGRDVVWNVDIPMT